MAGNNQKKNGSGPWRAMAVATSVSTEMAVTVILGVYGGRWLDGRLHTSGPWFMLAGLLLGLAAGILGIVKTLESFFGTGGK
ncbi:MAG TPA: AtpZ/AtpI family protein [Spirochaetia bacterium]|nr:AtpZ/AtpI family protein [Spirochaetia bacterium]